MLARSNRKVEILDCMRLDSPACRMPYACQFNSRAVAVSLLLPLILVCVFLFCIFASIDGLQHELEKFCYALSLIELQFYDHLLCILIRFLFYLLLLLWYLFA
ncbi:unnamed protein product [Ceratitis capitata]|uniref:(Mediterranean fruit fly) hypothetical protein n=1 Tax=Ceratitis capitata TaxID=7213 RepID=A0A811UBP9_CERCA|nr:unnamed protein product [Ceratitis capitata]